MFGCQTDNKKIMRRFENKNKNNAIGDSSAIFISLPLHSSSWPGFRAAFVIFLFSFLSFFGSHFGVFSCFLTLFSSLFFHFFHSIVFEHFDACRLTWCVDSVFISGWKSLPPTLFVLNYFVGYTFCVRFFRTQWETRWNRGSLIGLWLVKLK